MPTVKIYARPPELSVVSTFTEDFAPLVARLLSTTGNALNSEAILILCIPCIPNNNGLLIEIEGYRHPERIERKDQVCRDVVDFIGAKMPRTKPVFVNFKMTPKGDWGTNF